MISNEKAEEVVHFTYKVLFLLAKPPINFDKLLKQNEKEKLPDGWFMAYELSEEITHDVLKRIGKIYKLNKRDNQALRTQILLGCAPAYPKL